MPKQKVEGLITKLHDQLSTAETSPEQERLMQQMQSQLSGWEGDVPGDGDIRKTAELLIDELEEERPTLAMIAKDIVETLHNAGL